MAPEWHFRIFLSSPGDVAEERDIARELIDRDLPKRPGLRGQVTLDAISWDDPYASSAMPAHLTPQEAINNGALPRPSECDIVIVILWSRFGTPLPKAHLKPNGSPYQSGTEWEFDDALNAAKERGCPTTLVYWRSEKPKTEQNDPDFERKSTQYQKVKAFFAKFQDDDGALVGSYHTYSDPDDFQRLLSHHLVETIQLLKERTSGRSDAPSDVIHKPFMVDALPENFVPRPRELNELIGMLMDEDRTEPLAITTALRGAGGFGKTTLARAICHEEAIKNAFSDGILWVTLGEEPSELIGRVIDLIYMLSGKHEVFHTIEAATSRLKELLGDRRLLIVIDDVWNSAHLRPFLDGGPQCARLITTRYPSVSPENASRTDVDAMQIQEAIELLRPEAPSCAQEALAKLAGRLGAWPLLLKLAGAMMRERERLGQKLDDALLWVNTVLDRRGVTAFDAKDAEERDQAVNMTLDASLNQLNDAERQSFAELAVFPEDVEIPLAALEVLWELDTFDTEERCQRFFARGLLWSLDINTRQIRLHDVIRAYLRSSDLDLQALNANLVEAYRERSGGAWHNVPNDGYIIDMLPWHLVEAGQHEELRKLMFDLRWMQHKLSTRTINAIIADTELIRHDHEAEQLSCSLRMSAHVVNQDTDQLPAQLLGRLNPNNGALTARLLNQASTSIASLVLIPHGGQHLSVPGLLRQTFQGHSGPIHGAVELDDNRRALSWSRDSTLRLWDLETGESRVLEGHNGAVCGAVLLDKGHRALSWAGEHNVWRRDAEEDNTLRLWDLETGESRTLEGHSNRVDGAIPLDDGRRALSWSQDGTFRLWDLETGESHTLEGHSGAVSGAVPLDGGRRTLSWSGDSTLRLWDLETGESRALKGHSGAVKGAVLLDDGRRALSWAGWNRSNDHTLRLWDLETGESRALKGHSNTVSGAVLLHDGRRAISWAGEHNSFKRAAEDCTLQLWDLETGKSRALEGHNDRAAGAAPLDDGRHVLSWSRDCTLRLWDLETGESRVLEGHNGAVCGAVLLDKGQRALSWGEGSPYSKRTLRLWDLETGESRTLEGHSSAVKDAVLLDDGRRALSWAKGDSAEDNTLRLWDLEFSENSGFEGHIGAVNGVVPFDGGRRALSWAGESFSEDYTLRLWDLETGESRALKGHSGAVKGAVLLDSGRRALSWAGVMFSEDYTLRLWDLETGESRALKGHSDAVKGAVLLNGGRRALSWAGWFSGEDHTLRLWDLETGESRALKGHSCVVSGLVLLDEGRRVLSWASGDYTLRLWDLETGESRAFKGHGKWIGGAVPLDDGRRALSWASGASHHDNTLRLWDLETGESRALKGHSDAVKGAVLLNGGRRALSWSGDSTLRLWDLETGESRIFEGHSSAVSGVVLLGDGPRALSWAGSSLLLWDLESGESHALEGHSGYINGTVRLSDKRRALSWSHDQSLRLWDLKEFALLSTFVGDHPLTACAISKDEAWAIVGDARGKVMWINISSEHSEKFETRMG